MSQITAEDKKSIFNEHGGSETNTGSAAGQVALFTKRINHITDHLRTNKKDHSSRRSLLQMVGKRKRLLAYIAGKDIQAYRDLIKKLNLRR